MRTFEPRSFRVVAAMVLIIAACQSVAPATEPARTDSIPPTATPTLAALATPAQPTAAPETPIRPATPRSFAPSTMPSASLRTPESSPAVAVWSPCQGGLECARIPVPIDYAHPDGGTIEIALIRHAASSTTERLGSIVTNPGGPGASGVEFVRGNWGSFGSALTERFDIVGFDPRGVGASAAVRCLDKRPSLVDAFPTTSLEEEEFVELAQSVSAACEANSGNLLAFVGTPNVARDLDRIRIALAEEQLTYAGFSYGTLIGALYADMFPTNIRAMVLDGVVDPSLDLEAFVKDQSAASQSELDEFLDSCEAAASCLFRSPNGTAREAFDALMARFAEQPIDGVTAAVAWAAIYQQLTVDDDVALAEMLDLAQSNIGWPMASAGGWAQDAAALDGYDAVNCADYPAPRTADGFAAIADEVAVVAPDMGRPNTYTYFNCAFWPVPAQRVPEPVAGDGAPPILVVGSTGDPATPYKWAEALAAQLSSAVLVTRNGDGHIAQRFSGCIRDIVHAYLLTLETPAAGATCD